MAQYGFQPKPRENLGPLHMLPPRFEQILAMGRSIKKDQRTVGTAPSQATTVAEGDPERQPLSIPHLGMIFRQTGIPFTNPDIPNIGKLDSRFPAGFFYYQYTKPVHWTKDESFRHIPGYTRYVINKDGVIANAWSAKEVTGENAYMLELAADGANNLRRVPKSKLMALAFTQLPLDFVDYGRGNHSHDYEFDIEAGGYSWVPKPELTVKNNMTGQTDTYRNIFDFQENAGLSFDERMMIKPPISYTGVLDGAIIQVGNFLVKESHPKVKAEVATTVVDNTPEQIPTEATEVVATGTTTDTATIDTVDDIQW